MDFSDPKTEISVKKIIEHREGELLFYPKTKYEKIEIKCEFNHIFKLTLNKLYENCWCKECENFSGIEKIEKVLEELKLTFEIGVTPISNSDLKCDFKIVTPEKEFYVDYDETIDGILIDKKISEMMDEDKIIVRICKATATDKKKLKNFLKGALISDEGVIFSDYEIYSKELNFGSESPSLEHISTSNSEINLPLGDQKIEDDSLFEKSTIISAINHEEEIDFLSLEKEAENESKLTKEYCYRCQSLKNEKNGKCRSMIKISNRKIPQNAKLAFIYCRVSSLKQLENGTSLYQQEDCCIRSAVEKGYFPYIIARDQAISGGKKAEKNERAALRYILDLIRKDTLLVCYNMSRLSRNTLNMLEIHKEIHDKSGNLLFLTEKIDTTNAQGMLQFQIFSGFLEYERKAIAEKTRDNLRFLKLEGKIRPKPKFGWMCIGRKIAYIRNEKEQATIEYIREFRKANPKITLSEVCEHLNSFIDVHPCRKAKKWYGATLKAVMIDNKIGEFSDE